MMLHFRLIHLRLQRSSIIRYYYLACSGFCILNLYSFFFFFLYFLEFLPLFYNYLSCIVWEGLWNFFCYVFLLVLFGCAFVNTLSLTVFIDGQFSWSSHQESIGLYHSFKALPLLFSVYLSYFNDFRNFLFGLPGLTLYSAFTYLLGKKKKKIRIVMSYKRLDSAFAYLLGKKKKKKKSG